MLAAAIGNGSISAPVNIEAAAGARSKATGAGAGGLVIDCHGHYTTEPKALFDWRKRQIDAIGDPSQMPRIDELDISDDQLRESVEGAQLRLQRERGTSLTIFSPRASGMGHHVGDAAISSAWSRVSSDLVL